MTGRACPDRTGPDNRKPDYDTVREAMLRLMPGWFTKLDETMDPDGPEPYIADVRRIAAQTPEKPLDDIIHEYFQEDWFQWHADGDEDW